MSQERSYIKGDEKWLAYHDIHKSKLVYTGTSRTNRAPAQAYK
jgi:hypothetical protein